MNRQVLAESQGERAQGQPAQHQGKTPTTAEGRQRQGKHAGTQVQAVRQGEVFQAWIGDPPGRRLETLALAGAVGRNQFHQSGWMKRAGLGIDPGQNPRALRRAHQGTGRHQSNSGQPGSQQRSQGKDSQ